MFTLVAQAYYIKDDYKDTIAFTDKYVDRARSRTARCRRSSRCSWSSSSCVKLDDAACQTTQFERLVTYHPKPEYWQNLLYSVFQAARSQRQEPAADLSPRCPRWMC